MTATLLGQLDLAHHVVSAEHAVAVRGRAIARYRNTMIVASGVAGIALIDLTSGQITKVIPLAQNQMSDHNPVESMATGVTIEGNDAFISMDNYTLTDGPPAFRGIIVFNLDTQTVEQQLVGLDAGASNIFSDSRSVFVDYLGSPIVSYDIDKLHGKKLPSVSHRVFNFGLKGQPVGTPAIDDTYLYTCFVQDASGVDQPNIRGPRVFARAALGL